MKKKIGIFIFIVICSTVMLSDWIERIYIGRRFKNDSERLQKLFSMYADLLERQTVKKKETAPKRRKKSSDQTELNMENRP